MGDTLLRFAIIGCGRIAERHALNIQKSGKLVVVYDIITQKAKLLAEKFGTLYCENLEELFTKKIDVVAVCSPNGVHMEHTVRSLNAGFHVLCEKPMALTVSDCEKMIDAAEKNNKKLFIVKQNRFNPYIQELKKILEEKRLGKIYSVELNCFWNRDKEYYQDSWRGTKEMDGGTLFTQFSHFIDLLYWLIGGVKDVSGYMANFAHRGVIDFEDTGVINFQFKNGSIGTMNYTVNSYQKNMEGSLTMFGEKGTVKIGGEYLNKLEYQNIENYKIEYIAKGNPANDYGKYMGSMSNHDKVYQNLVEVLTTKSEMSASGMEGLKTIEIIQEIYSKSQFL